jgi:cytoplasmic iron level regulating protein YaaA (DUF328/UPF0246 family)
VLVLLPPSEGKTAPSRRRRPLDLGALSSPGLTPLREKLLAALIEASARPDAAEVLGVAPGLAADVARNTRLLTAPTAPAREVYTGVLYAAAGLTDLPRSGRSRADRDVRIVSGLWGLVAPSDPIPAYRLSMGTDLPGIGPLASAGRGALGVELDARADGELVVDCRSSAYLAAWRPPRTADWVTVRVERELDGRRSVVSHHAKHTRGVLLRHLLVRAGRPPRTAEQLAAAARELIGTTIVEVELATPGRAARDLTLVVH